MSKFRRFFMQYMILPLLMPTLSAAYAAYNATTEVGPVAYATLAAAWPSLHQPSRDAIARALAAGKLREWDYHPLFNAALNDSRGLVMPDPATLGTAAQEREKLRAVMQHGA